MTCSNSSDQHAEWSPGIRGASEKIGFLCRVIHPIAEPLNVQAAADGQFLHPRDRAAVGAEQNHRAKMG